MKTRILSIIGSLTAALALSLVLGTQSAEARSYYGDYYYPGSNCYYHGSNGACYYKYGYNYNRPYYGGNYYNYPYSNSYRHSYSRHPYDVRTRYHRRYSNRYDNRYYRSYNYGPYNYRYNYWY